jgi:homoserine dehydrogenase
LPAAFPSSKRYAKGWPPDHIEWIAGIINGTGNFILSEMRDKGRAFADVLAEAQALGYAEADPTFDVEGIDAAHKLTILGSLAFGIPLQFERCFTEGISRIDAQDVANAAELGYRIKHLGIARRSPGGIELRVHPDPDPRAALAGQCRWGHERGAGQGRCGRTDPLLWGRSPVRCRPPRRWSRIWSTWRVR